MPLTNDCIRMTIRHTAAVLIGILGILSLKFLFATNFDNVAAVGLFSCIIAVSGEDISLGPIIHKSILRSIGVCIGGFCAYIMLFIPTELLSSQREVCLMLLPAGFVLFTQWSTKGGWTYVSKLVKENKASHMIIQLQIAFGVVYIGSWQDSSASPSVAIIRTLAILYGCLAIFLSSMIAIPLTSLNVSAMELSECLRSVGKLAVSVCNDKTHGVMLLPYDHRAKAQATASTSDEHTKFMDAIDGKLNRVTALQPFLLLEPAWVPGLSRSLIGKEKHFAVNWKPFIARVVSRVSRLRCTLTVMDSNSRIDSDVASKRYVPEIASNLEALSIFIKESFDLIAAYVDSPFKSDRGWRGDVALRGELIDSFRKTKRGIQMLAASVVREVNLHSTVQVEKTVLPEANEDEEESTIPNTFRSTSPLKMRSRIGSTIDWWHKMYPMRSFCSLAVQTALQTCTLVVDVISFIDYICERDTGGASSEAGPGRRSEESASLTADINMVDMHPTGGSQSMQDQYSLLQAVDASALDPHSSDEIIAELKEFQAIAIDAAAKADDHLVERQSHPWYKDAQGIDAHMV